MPTYSPETEQKLGKLLLKLTNNPKTRNIVTRAMSEVDPSIKFAEHDSDDLRSYVRAEFEKRDEDAEREKQLRQLALARRRVMDTFGDDDEVRKKHIEGVEKVMQDTGLLDYPRAAKLYAAENPPPAPKPEGHSGVKWEMPNTEKLFTDQKSYERDLANAAVAEIMAKRQTG